VNHGALHRETGECLLPRVWRTTNALDRMRGLLGRPSLQSGEGLLIDRCAAVHTFGMRYRIDVAFLDARGVVRKLVPHLAPRRMAGCRGARMTLEMSAGSIQRLGLREGLSLQWHEAA